MLKRRASEELTRLPGPRIPAAGAQLHGSVEDSAIPSLLFHLLLTPRPQVLLLLLLGPTGEDLKKKLYQSLCHQPQGGRGQQDLPWEELEAMRRKTVVEETFLLELLFTSIGSATSCH